MRRNASRATKVVGSYKEAPPDGRARFVTTRVDPELAKDLAQYDVKFSGVVESTFLRDVLSWIVPALVFIGALAGTLVRETADAGGVGF